MKGKLENKERFLGKQVISLVGFFVLAKRRSFETLMLLELLLQLSVTTVSSTAVVAAAADTAR